MKYGKYLLTLSLWGATIFSFTDKSFLAYRSQGFNLARADAGWQTHGTKNNASIAVEYTQSFDGSAISKYFFGCTPLVFSGSLFPDRGKNDILADYYGLPTDFKSTINFSPRVQNIITDVDLYWNLSDEEIGFNLRVDIPLVHSKWELNPCETIVSTGTLDYPAGYMSNALIKRENLSHNALSVLSGNKKFGDLTFPLQYGRILRCSQQATKFADILIAMGYTFISSQHGMLGADIHVIVPTGTRSQAINLFEPQIGNGHHWALGASLKGRYDFYSSDDEWVVSACFDTYIQHLFKTTQKRSYDLIKNGPASRYALLEDMISRVSITQNFSATPFENIIDNQYITRLLYVIDATTFDSKIRVDVQADLIAKLNLKYHNWNFDIGYNFWARSKEKLVSRACLNHKFYGVKGDAQLYGFLNVGVELPLPLNATQSESTIHAAQGDGNTNHNFINSNADNAALMYNFGAPIAQTKLNSLTNTGITSLEQVNGSNQAIVLTDDDINDCSALSPRAFSNKIFGSVSCNIGDIAQSVTGYLSLGAEGEFSGTVDYAKTAISQWGVWIKGSINY